MAQIPDAVATLERDVRDIFGGRFQSLVVYGLHAHGAPHDDEHQGAGHHEPAMTHTMIVTDTLTAGDLKACADRLASWNDAGLATPLLLAAREFERSLDVFPLEFGAIVADHAVAAGRNPFEGVSVDAEDVRRACESQARSHLLHLREGYVETRGRADALAVLIVASAAPLARLVKTLARLDGLDPHDAGAAARHAERATGAAPDSIADIVALADVREISSEAARRLMAPYLDASERIVALVDGWGAR